jgi:hypothetical protein
MFREQGKSAFPASVIRQHRSNEYSPPAAGSFLLTVPIRGMPDQRLLVAALANALQKSIICQRSRGNKGDGD